LQGADDFALGEILSEKQQDFGASGYGKNPFGASNPCKTI